MTEKIITGPSLFPPTSDSEKEAKIKHWHLGRQQRIIPNKHIYYTLKSFEKYLKGKKCILLIEEKIREYLIKKAVMRQPKVNKTKKNITHGQIKTKPGTIRTLISQYIYLGLHYRDREKCLHFTQAGEKILSLKYERKGKKIKGDEKKIDKIITHMLCRLQFNSEHYHSVGMSLDIKLKPICFLIKLLQEKDLSFYLTKEEMYIPYLKAKTIDDYDKIVEDIRRFREIKDLPYILGQKITDTIRNQSFPQLLVDRGILKKDNQRYSLNENYSCIILLKKLVKRYKKDKKYISVEEHGKWGKEISGKFDEGLKNELKIIIKNCSTIPQLEETIKGQPREREMKSILKSNPELISELKFEHELISDFLKTEKGDIVEHKVKHFSQDILKIQTYHTGRIKNGKIRGNHSDNLNVFKEQGCCGIIDTKVNSERCYALTGNDHRNMKGYIETYKDLLSQLDKRYPRKDLKNLKLSYAGFISSGFSKVIEKNLLKLKKETGVSIFAITISDYIALAPLLEEKKIPIKHFLHVMSKGGIITLNSFNKIT